GVAICDFNADGLLDQAIGVPNEDVGTLVDAGAVDAMYGSTAGLQTVTPQGQFWTQDSPGIPDQAVSNNRFGWSLACADFNGDGFCHLVVGIPFEATGGHQRSGAATALYGSATGLQSTGEGGPDDQLWSQDSSGVEDQAESADRFAWALAVADFNGDG